jgi:hypothetical protein
MLYLCLLTCDLNALSPEPDEVHMQRWSYISTVRKWDEDGLPDDAFSEIIETDADTAPGRVEVVVRADAAELQVAQAIRREAGRLMTEAGFTPYRVRLLP